MSNEAFREKIGLDYLIKGQQAASGAGAQEVDWALQAQSMKILTELQRGTGTSHLQDLVKSLDVDLFTLKRAADYLAASGLAEVTPDQAGNDEVKLTTRGWAIRV